ncbi:response regulator [Argonema galeatum]|uniref:response regulator n=1 Tax=Argonema galeatum TaxID=2942762 RepID=UPI0020119281|nr:response regulator [Argonema galeatum]MCL1463959.1 response regulator [Argonema galeatum A003/A1]
MNKPVIICVDDEYTILDSLKIELKRAIGDEYLIETAEGGEDALELLSELLKNEYEIALVISDYIMPDIKGDELLKRIHAILPKTIKIMLTGQADIEAVANTINNANLYRYIAKPWQSEDLRLTVKEAVRRYCQEKKLVEQNSKLENYNHKLEELVKIRTQELEEKNRQLQQEIRERQQVESALQASDVELRAIFAAMTDVVMVRDAQGRCLKIAPTYTAHLYKQAADMIGKTLHDVLPKEPADLILSCIQQALLNHQTVNIEYSLTIKDREVWLSANISPLSPDSVILVARDITDRKRREEALRLIVEGTASKTGGIFMHSCVRYLAEILQVRYALVTELANREKTKVRTLAFWNGTDFNENIEFEIAGTPCGETILNAKLCYYPNSLKAHFPNNKFLNDLGIQSYAGMPLFNSNGNVLGHLVVMDVKPMGNDQRIELILEIFAARAGAELERKKAEEKLQESVYAADAANRAKSQFLSKMSHELRTPLNAILGFTQVMNRDSSLSAEQKQHLGIISRSGEHLLTLINDILEMSKIEAGRVTLNENSFDLCRLLGTLNEMFQLKAKSKGLELIFDLFPDVPQYVKTDGNKLHQVLINLLGNAIKFTESGAVVLRVKNEDKEDFSATSFLPDSKVQRLLFEVEDTGPGIAREEINLLFAPFGQTETGRKSEQGTGLGLPISRQFVQLMGGDITMNSTVGKGTTFKFNIPVCVVESHQVPTSQDTRKVIGLAPNQLSYRILVVEDVKVSRLLLVKLLTTVGFGVRAAVNGMEAVALWESWKPHLILMDMQMPVMDGYEATKRIKAHPLGGSIAIVALTASAFEEDRIAILSAGCDDFVSKPFSIELILEKMAQYLGVLYIYDEPVAKSLEVKSQQQEVAIDLVSPDLSHRSARPLDEYLSQMPTEWVTQLYQAAAQCSDSLIFELIEQIPANDSPLAKTLKDWADEFRFDKVIDFIQQTKK